MSFGAWTEKAARKYMDAVVPTGYSLHGDTYNGYVVRDDYRPGMEWKGKTPAAALRKAGVWVPKNCFGYND